MATMMSVRRWVLLAAGVAVLLALALSLEAGEASALCRGACDGGSPYEWRSDGQGLPEDPSPYVAQVSPQDGATGVPRATNVKVTFSEPMDASTVNGSTFQLHSLTSIFYGGAFYSMEAIPTTVSKDPSDPYGRTYLLDPYGATSMSLLSANKKYMVTVTTGVRDFGDYLPLSSEKVWYFTTGTS
jgi:hypothetical protein